MGKALRVVGYVVLLVTIAGSVAGLAYDFKNSSMPAIREAYAKAVEAAEPPPPNWVVASADTGVINTYWGAPDRRLPQGTPVTAVGLPDGQYIVGSRSESVKRYAGKSPVLHRTFKGKAMYVAQVGTRPDQYRFAPVPQILKAAGACPVGLN